MHYWGDEDFDWNGLNEAIRFTVKKLRKYRIGVYDWKEKYGTARISVKMGFSQLHDIVYPSYVWNRFPKWLWKLDCQYLSIILQPIGLLVARYIHAPLYRRAYKLTIEKYPQFREEFLDMPDHPELLEGL